VKMSTTSAEGHDRFSGSRFVGEAGSRPAAYTRDLENTQIRMLLRFMC